MPATLDRTFAALGDEARLTLVNRLAAGPATVRSLAEPFDISRPAISKHLRVLTEAGIVGHTRNGREHWYSLTPDGLTAVDEWIDEVADTWKKALGSLKRLVEEDPS